MQVHVVEPQTLVHDVADPDFQSLRGPGEVYVARQHGETQSMSFSKQLLPQRIFGRSGREFPWREFPKR